MAELLQWDDFSQQGRELMSLRAQAENHTLVHALLIKGEPGTGKKSLAILMAATLLCEEDNRPCGHCKSCRMILSDDHPDLVIVRQGSPLNAETKAGRTTIPVDDIREMIRLCAVRPVQSRQKVVLIFQADRLTVQAQNSLLKTLEDPPQSINFILVSDHSEALLMTIISRCRSFRMKPWTSAYIRDILNRKNVSPAVAADAAEASDGSIGNAVKLADDQNYWKMREELMALFFGSTRRSAVPAASNSWKDRKDDAELLCAILENLVETLLKCRLGSENASLSASYPPQWQRMAREADPITFSRLLTGIAEARKQLQSFVNFQAVFERLLLQFIGEGNIWLE